MSEWGLTDTGFVPKAVEDVEASIDARLRDGLGASLPLGPRTVLGIVDGIMSAEFAELWEVAAAVNASQDPDGAAATSLDALCALTGTRRRAARSSTDVLTLTGDPATTIPAGNVAKALSTGAKFATTADATTVTLAAWVAVHGYVVGDRVTNSDGGTDRCYTCVAPGNSAASGGPVTETADETDGTVHWRFLGEGTAAVDAASASAEKGPIEALSGDLVVISTPVGGWLGVVNLLDATPGELVETDEQLRLRRELELARAGTGPADAIRADVLEVTGVTSCRVFVNDTEVTDADGVPAHSVEIMVEGGVDQDILDQVWASVAAGIGTYGNVSGTVLDSEGVEHTVKFSRPEDVDAYVDLTLVKDPDAYPSDGDAQVKAAIVAYGDALAIGRDVVATAVGAQAYRVAGVLDVPRSGSLGGCLISDAPTPTSDATIVITSRQRASYDTSRITLHTSDGTP